MEQYSKSTHWTEVMNRMGRQRQPFLFILPFSGGGEYILSPQEALEMGISFQVPSMKTQEREDNIPLPPLVFTRDPVSFSEYEAAFHIVRNHILQGNSYLVNLTFPTRIAINRSLEEIYRQATAPYKLLFGERFVVFSPETFIQIREGRIWSFPMKGTIDADLPSAREHILNDVKEIAEHNTIVDLIRNDLSQVATRVEVEEYRFITQIETNFKSLLQVSSRIRGELPDDYPDHLGSILGRLLPAGSISGAPKEKTLAVIREAESSERGYYTGVFGYFDGKTLDSAVMIRFIEQTEQGLQYRSGGGITCFSDLHSEYREMIDKVYVPVV